MIKIVHPRIEKDAVWPSQRSLPQNDRSGVDAPLRAVRHLMRRRVRPGILSPGWGIYRVDEDGSIEAVALSLTACGRANWWPISHALLMGGLRLWIPQTPTSH